ncbi:transmembrane protein 212 [Gastrophryne carolinensis]
MSNFYHITGGILTAFGLLSIISGVIAFFPVLSYKPLFIGWSVRIACPIWNGALAFSVGVLALLSYREWTQRSLWESTFTLGLLSIIGSPVQFSLAIASILIGPYCYYTFAGMSSTNYIGYAIKFPFPYTKFQNVCQDPLHYESYHLALQTIDLLSSVLIFCSSLALVIRLSARILRTGTFNADSSPGKPPGYRYVPPHLRLSELKEFHDTKTSGHSPRAMCAVSVENEPEYVINKNLDSRKLSNSLQYVIEGFGPEERCWVAAKDDHGSAPVKKYCDKPDKLRPFLKATQDDSLPHLCEQILKDHAHTDKDSQTRTKTAGISTCSYLLCTMAAITSESMHQDLPMLQ